VTNIVIRQVEGEEMLEVKYPLGTYAFRSSPPLPDKEEWKDQVRHRQGVTCLAAFEGDAAVATVAYTAMTQNVRGALLGMGGVWGVLQVSPAKHADCALSIQALAALLYGTHDPGDFAFRGWGDPSPQVQATMRAMFPRMLPHMHEMF
jgi:hypothetical protein